MQAIGTVAGGVPGQTAVQRGRRDIGLRHQRRVVAATVGSGNPPVGATGMREGGGFSAILLTGTHEACASELPLKP